LIGINYFGTKAELKGCINDVKNVKAFLMKNGFPDTPEAMTVLTDDSKSMPTKGNIMAACGWLVKDAQVGDCLFFHYSGHGGQQEDKDGDEADGYDETILPCDYQKNGMIVDDDLHTILVKPLKQGIRFTAVFDSCHSGTALDLPFVYKATGTYQGPVSKSQIGSSVLTAGMAFLSGDKKGAFSQIKSTVTNTVAQTQIDAKNKKEKSSDADIVMIAGCKDDQTSADASIGGAATGAMSFALMTFLSQNPRPTLIQLLNGMRDLLASKNFTQIPQMSTGHEMDPNQVFSLA